MSGVMVDGQDVREVYEATRLAVVRARRSEGPTLIEAKTYRFDEHQVGLIVPGAPSRTLEQIAQHRAVSLGEKIEECSGGSMRKPSRFLPVDYLDARVTASQNAERGHAA